MSVGGGGLCFLIRVPTAQHERDVHDVRQRTPPSPNKTQNGVSNLHVSSEAVDDSTQVKSRLLDPLEQILRKSLEELRILDALWVLDKDEHFYQVSFTCNAGLPCDLVLTSLATNGIGMCRGSSLIVLPCTVWLQEDEDDIGTQSSRDSVNKMQFICEDEKKSDSDASTLNKTKSEVKKAFKNFKDMQKKFLQTVTARLTVAQVVDGVRAGSEPTFDFIMFVLIASMIAALGLLENSSVIIVASMLISPIMGPIMAGTFGAVIRDKGLRNLGIKTEILGLFLCVLIGFTLGMASETLNSFWGNKHWPNSEMISRGQERSLWVGALIALPSGAGVALSILAGNAGSLVGVAISASLLPPAVNAGLLWGMAAIRAIRAEDEQPQFIRLEGVTRLLKPSLAPSADYEVNYYMEMDRECAMLGLVSLALALVNIVCIFFSALIVLKIKEVAPKTSMSRTARFWKEDIKIARNYNVTSPVSEEEELGAQFLAEWATLNGLEPEALLSDDAEAAITRMATLKDIMTDVENDEVFQRISRSMSNAGDYVPISKRISIMTGAANLGVPALTVDDTRFSSSKWIYPHNLNEDEKQEGQLPPALQDVELRRPHPQAATSPLIHQSSPSSRSSVALLRQSLANVDRPYTLWPPTTQGRFLVTPVPEDQTFTLPTSPTRKRVSRFLKDPCVIMKETTC